MIQMRVIAAPAKTGDEVAASTSGSVSEIPVPPAMARRFVPSHPRGDLGKNARP